MRIAFAMVAVARLPKARGGARQMACGPNLLGGEGEESGCAPEIPTHRPLTITFSQGAETVSKISIENKIFYR
ncbi:MAG: hypothetical protein KGM49_14855 [Sphingomonadales bacterium]|nr:hypothetical protein [Sphingomonadales bacterium]